MNHLKKLTIATDLNEHSVSPVIKARSRLILALNEQLKAAEAMVAGEIYQQTRMRWQNNDDTGERVRVAQKMPIRKWYWRDAEGKVRFCLRVSNKRLELQKGKTNIVVGDDKELPAVIQTCIEAAEDGEFDEAIGLIVEQRIARQKSK
jgi:hypothetical protein